MPTSSVPDLAHDLRIACMKVARRVRYDAGNTIAPALFSVLVRLSEEPRTVGELASIEQVSAPSMSRTVAQLCEAGYAVRSADEHDGRLVRLTLTPEGKKRVKAERAHRDAWMTERLADLTAEDREVLRRAADLIDQLVTR